jgi:hypothetical protein
MASKTKRTKAVRSRKKRPNKKNLKADLKRVQKNAQILRDLASKDAA